MLHLPSFAVFHPRPDVGLNVFLSEKKRPLSLSDPNLGNVQRENASGFSMKNLGHLVGG